MLLKKIPFITYLVFLILLALCFSSEVSFAVSAQKNTGGLFDTITVIPIKYRVKIANEIYKAKLRKVQPAAAMDSLNKLNAYARKQNDKALECAIYDMRADYYSVNRGFNNISTAYYLRAITFAEHNHLRFEYGYYMHRIALYYSIYKKHTRACQYFLRSQEIFNEIEFKNIPEIGLYLMQVGDFYYSLADYDNARSYLNRALNYIPADKRERVSITNTLGLIQRNYGNYQQALAYFNTTYRLALVNKDSILAAVAYGNIGSVYFLQHQYKKSLPYILLDYHTSIRHGEIKNGLIALLRLTKINIDEERLPEAKRLLQTADSLILKVINDPLKVRVEIYNLKSQWYEAAGQASYAIIYRKKYEEQKDSLIKRDNIAAVERVRLKYELDQHNTKINHLETEARILTIEIVAAIAVLALLSVIFVLTYKRQRLKSDKDKALLLAEKRLLDQELKAAAAELKSFTENLRQKNKMIEGFKAEIKNLKIAQPEEANVPAINSLMQPRLMTNDNWNEFRTLFSRVYPGFFIAINQHHSNLTITETRLLALIKLGLSNTELANVLSITVDGIKKAKQRLRKKVDIDAIVDGD